MSKIKTILEEAGEQLKPVLKDAKNQVVGERKTPEQQKFEEERKKQTAEAVKQMYAPSSDEKKPEEASVDARNPQTVLNPEDNLKPEEKQKLEQLKQQLHQETYYDPTFNRKPQEEEHQAEKVEREKEEENMELMQKEEKKKKKSESIAVQREQNKAEQFRGASG